MIPIKLIDSIFEADYIRFTNELNEIKVFEGYFYIIGMYEFNYNKEIVLLCQCINNEKLYLNYKEFNYYLIHGRIFYYSNICYINEDNFLYEDIKNCKKRKIKESFFD